MTESINISDLVSYEEQPGEWICGEVVALGYYGVRIRQCDPTFTVPTGPDVFIEWSNLPPLIIASPGGEPQLTDYITRQIALLKEQRKRRKQPAKVTVSDSKKS